MCESSRVKITVHLTHCGGMAGYSADADPCLGGKINSITFFDTFLCPLIMSRDNLTGQASSIVPSEAYAAEYDFDERRMSKVVIHQGMPTLSASLLCNRSLSSRTM